MHASRSAMSRRGFLLGMGGTAAFALAGPRRGHAMAPGEPARSFTLTARKARAAIVGPPHAETEIWAYDGRSPGPEIRVRQGERLRVLLRNELDEDTTIHWHGVRVPNAMDGVPHVTQPPVAPGGEFVYDFAPPDAGTYWYHPHHRGFEQVGRGLYGPLIVEEREPIAVDRDLVWMLGDWRLQKNAAISDDFADFMDLSHAGRIGNTVTINGRVPDAMAVAAGERIRLRLVNAANGRIFGLNFAGHRPQVIAYDGHAVDPHEPPDGRVILAPGMRIDVVIDMSGRPGDQFDVTDDFYPQFAYRLVRLAYGDTPLRDNPLDAPMRLADNPLPEPDLQAVQRHEVVLAGGMMGGMRGARVDGAWMDVRQMTRRGLMWSINGAAATDHVMEPMAVLRRGQSQLLDIRNDTAWPHPLHLHGHAFRVLSRDGTPSPHREWQDTVLLSPRERVEVAFVADNPGDWLFHCHVLEHAAGGMMGVLRVA